MIKLTIDSCRRMWQQVISAQCSRIGRIWPYQSASYKSRQSIGRCFRLPSGQLFLLADPLEMERRIAARIAQRLKDLDLKDLE